MAFRWILLILVFAVASAGRAQKTDIVKLPVFSTGPRYGAGCGFVGVDPEPRVAIEAMIRDKYTVGILAWLHDTAAVYQAYGAEAVIRLERNGVMFAVNDLALVEEIKRSKKKIDVCSGCSTWPEEMGQAVKMFSKRD